MKHKFRKISSALTQYRTLIFESIITFVPQSTLLLSAQNWQCFQSAY